jgi:peptidoglycan-associated lipoprotein
MGTTLMKRIYPMKYSSILSIAGCALLLFSGCQKKSDSNMWDDNQTGAKYRNNSSSLWGSSGAGDLQSTSQDDFIALSDDDLKTQFADLAVAQPSHSLGEGGLPGADAFQNPTGELAAVFHPLFFNTDEHTLKSKESIDAIRSMAEYLKAHPHIAIIVEGHADERGPEAYNLSLGARRANYIRSHGPQPRIVGSKPPRSL